MQTIDTHMSQPLRRRPVIKKRAKPLAEVHKGLLHQSVKLITKTVKLVKAFLIQKCTRKIVELKESDSDESEEVRHLSELKAVDHAVYGKVVANKMLSIGNKDIQEDSVDETILGTVMKQKKIIEVVQEVEKHIKEAVEKNNIRRAEEQRNEAKQAKKAKHLLEKRTLSMVGEMHLLLRSSIMKFRPLQKERTEGVFLDTLEAPEEKPVDAESKKKQKEREKVKIEKSLRNRQNRLKNKVAKGGDGKGAEGKGDKAFKKRKFSSRSSGEASGDSNLSIYGPGSSNSGSSGRDHLAPPSKSQKTNHTAVIPAVVPTEKLEKIAASGKDWKEVRLVAFFC